MDVQGKKLRKILHCGLNIHLANQHNMERVRDQENYEILSNYFICIFLHFISLVSISEKIENVSIIILFLLRPFHLVPFGCWPTQKEDICQHPFYNTTPVLFLVNISQEDIELLSLTQGMLQDYNSLAMDLLDLLPQVQTLAYP